MITKEQFLKSIKTIERFEAKQNKVMKSLYESLEMDGYPIMMFGSDLINLSIELLASHFNNNTEDIEYYLFECRGMKEGGCIDGYRIKTSEDLYNYLRYLQTNIK